MVFLRAWFGFDWVSDGGATLADLVQLMTLLMNRPTAINSFGTKINFKISFSFKNLKN